MLRSIPVENLKYPNYYIGRVIFPTMDRRGFIVSALSASALTGCLGEENDSPTTGETTDDSGQTSLDEDRQTQVAIYGSYRNGAEKHDEGAEYLQNGSEMYNNERYTEAISELTRAEDAFSDAETRFSDAVDKTYDIESTDAREIADNARQVAVLYLEASRKTKRASEESIDDNVTRANELIEEANSAQQEARRLGVQSTEVMRSALDIELSDTP